MGNDLGAVHDEVVDRVTVRVELAVVSDRRHHLITGARVVDVDSDGSNYGESKSTSYNNEVVPYAGVIYDLNEQYSVYASYTNIFQPQDLQDEGGRTLDPLRGDNYEVGVKGEFMGVA